MTTEQINIALARATGWVNLNDQWQHVNYPGPRKHPMDYTLDSPVHHAESVIINPHNARQMRDWSSVLWAEILGSEEAKFGVTHANASQRAIALLKLKGLWE